MVYHDRHVAMRPPLEVENIDTDSLSVRDLALIAVGSMLCARLHTFSYAEAYKQLDPAALAAVIAVTPAVEQETVIRDHVANLFKVCRAKTEVDLRIEAGAKAKFQKPE